jgi:peptidyl-tRNA hydrolase
VTELVLPFVLRIERSDPPPQVDALEAAARAVLLMLTTDRPEWVPAVRAWDGQRIRKVVRRARGAEWRRALTVDGLDVVHGGAELRIYPPVPVDDWPPELSRLQVGGTNLDQPSEPPPVPAGTPLVLLSPHVDLSTGKAMAQAAHAAQLGWRDVGRARRRRWLEAGLPVAVRDASVGEWDAAIARGAPVVHDGGFTEVAPGTPTALFTVSR